MNRNATAQLTREEMTQKAKRYCAYQERCTSDLKRKLLSWGADPLLTDEIIALLKNENFLSDKRYAALFAISKINQNRWGRLKIEKALQQKDIPHEIIRNAMKETDPGQYEKNIMILIRQKMNEMKETDPLKIRQKILQFMLSKGYEAELIHKMLNPQE
jgi:regulatory protein